MKCLLNSQEWQSIVDNAREALKINIYIADANGFPVYVSENGNRYGWKISDQHFRVRSVFKDLGHGRLEWADHYGFLYYALEFKDHISKTNGFVVLGPVVLNKRLSNQEYKVIASKNEENVEDLIGRLEEIRVISYLNLEAILKTIDALLKLSPKQENVVNRKDDGSHKRQNIILESMFELSLAITDSTSGSLMLFDTQTKELAVSMSRGIDQNFLQNRIKLDQGVSGIAFKEQKNFVLKNKKEPKRLGPFLNRSEIKESIVMPFETPDKKLRGVINLNRMTSQAKPCQDLADANQKVSQVVSDILSAF